jgi:hypothetical protein
MEIANRNGVRVTDCRPEDGTDSPVTDAAQTSNFVFDCNFVERSPFPKF